MRAVHRQHQTPVHLELAHTARMKDRSHHVFPLLRAMEKALHLQLAAAEHLMLGRSEKQTLEQVGHCPLELGGPPDLRDVAITASRPDVPAALAVDQARAFNLKVPERVIRRFDAIYTYRQAIASFH